MAIRLTFEIRLASDYHSGAGFGAGFGVDSALLRDGDGVPVLRGTALGGLLRASLAELLAAPPLRHVDAEDALARLFGSSALPKRWYFGSARPVPAPKPLIPRAWTTVRDAQSVHRVRISPLTRRAEDGKLFTTEEGDRRLVFRFTATCYENGPAAADDAALLTAAARGLRRLGRSRNRGSGACTLHLVAAEGCAPEDTADGTADLQAALLAEFRKVWIEGTPAPLPPARPAPDFAAPDLLHAPNPAGAEDEVRLRVVLRLDEPLLVTERGVAGNQYATKARIDGGVLLGALANLGAHALNLNTAAGYRTFAELFLAGGVRCSALHYAYEGGSRLYATVPAPLDWLTCKVHPFGERQEGHGVFLPAELGGPARCPVCASALEAVEGFVVARSGPPCTAFPAQASELHIRIDPVRRQVAEGNLYGYTTLSAGQYFVGDLACAPAAWTLLQEELGLLPAAVHTLHLGKARRRGYGAVSLWLEPLGAELLPVPWAQRRPDPAAPIPITLLGDAIVVDNWGRQPAGWDAAWLAAELDLGPLEIKAAFARRTVVDGFNGYRGLPRWRDMALAAGSTAWVQLLDPPADWEARMQARERDGIGTRRSEGFGRLAFNYLRSAQRAQCKAVVTLAQPLKLGTSMGILAAGGEQSFLESWEDTLASVLRRQLPPPDSTTRDGAQAAALARWIYTHVGDPPAEVQAALGALAAVAPELVAAVGGPEEYGARSKENYFGSDGSKLVAALDGALAELAKHGAAYWPLGLRVLADFVSAGSTGSTEEASS